MKRWRRNSLVAALLALSIPVAAWADVVILHTNDIHCGADRNFGLARVAQYKKDLAKEYPAVFLVENGDSVQGGPIGKFSKGQDMMALLAAADYDFATPGNHDFDYGMARFFELAKQLPCGYFSANFMDLTTGKTVFPACKTVEADGKRIAFIGVTTPETLVSSTPTFFQNADGDYVYGFREDETGAALYAAIQETVDEARANGADFVILVGHLGSRNTIPVWSSAAVVRATRGIDAVIDGHSHEIYIREDKNADGKPVLVSQTGTQLERLGQMILHDDGTVSATLLDALSETKEEPTVSALLQKAKEKAERELAVELGVATVDFTDTLDGVWAVRHAETNLGDMAADAAREYYHADVALINAGSLQAPLPQGTITYGSLMKVFPFGNGMALRDVTGQQILDALEMGAREFPTDDGAFFQVSGLTYTIEAAVPSSVEVDAKGNFVSVRGERRVKDVKVGGVPIDPHGDYRVCGNAYILKFGGDGMTMFRDSVLLRDEDVTDADTLRAFIEKRGGTIGEGYERPEGEGRIVVRHPSSV